MGRRGGDELYWWVSAETERKEQDFAGLLQMHTTLCKRLVPRSGQPYLYVDLYAGPGVLHDPKRPWRGEFDGSPLVAQRAMADAGFAFESLHYEANQVAASLLAEAVRTVFGCRFQDGFPVWLDQAGSHPGRYGLVYADPISDEIPVTVFNQAADRFPRVDLLAYVQATQYKRRRGQDIKRNGQSGLPLLEDHVHAVHKDHALIREPAGPWQATFILWTNWRKFPVWKQHGFYELRSARGQAVLDRLNLTKPQLHERVNVQLPFGPTGPTPNTSGIPSSAPSAPSSSSGPAASVSAAGSGPRPSRTISPTRRGEPSMSPRTSSPSAIPATAEPTGSNDE